MTDWREELIEKMAFMMFAYVEEQSRLRFGDIARAALAVAEPVIREQTESALREENARLREALNGWQKWWELPWEGKRPDFAELVYRRAAAIAKASAVNPRDEGAPTI